MERNAVLITGATGLIGAALVRHFASQNRHVIAAVRNIAKGQAMFAATPGVELVEWDVLEKFPAVSAHGADIVHAASETSSRSFIERPVETIRTILRGTENALEAARALDSRAFVMLSTMEVYGAPDKPSVTEKDFGYLDPVAPRSSYPEAKRMAEAMCVAYAKEYGVHARIARLTQTFGEGVRPDDMRVFAEFARAISQGRDIVLKTPGETARCYCDIADAVAAIETIMEKGEDATAYTVANEETYCTIREMAEMLVSAYPESGSKVKFDFAGAEERGFAPPFKMRLDCSRLRSLGWSPRRSLLDSFRAIIKG